ncbi:NAD(P)/FAD-dependent oxidoreductase [Duganella dendranthematis]|jgi:thioredoxin reductase|uniref:NAD(P)/FAD-dependent oxidoreductase n=1 Tax=Duganella dendranthematis TaxID=2728021 RepID=A0ABX6MC74_9BURK|nr:NAD(P)/FAD-dependent oxidoreductase [Duganella dendranthematis]QJD91941.1 NAD(P)/FAD-dependent oxidoreductase [Duganella dendranthematis]
MGIDEFDVIVIGGSYAGLSAATQLARARRRVLVIDAGQRRNRYASHSHGFLGQDGREGAAIAADGRAQLMKYRTVSWREGLATQAVKHEDGFRVTLSDGSAVHAQRLVLATGMADELPSIPGLAERWGSSVFHCPYCHGYELNQGRIGVLATGPHSWHHAMMLPDWGQVTFFLNGAFEPDEEQLTKLAARGVTIERTRVQAVSGTATVTLTDHRALVLDGLFVLSRLHSASPLGELLGCEMEDGPMGRYLRTDMMKATSVAGVYACGDAARMAGSVAFAVADGAMAGVAAHQSLVFGLPVAA